MAVIVPALLVRNLTKRRNNPGQHAIILHGENHKTGSGQIVVSGVQSAPVSGRSRLPAGRVFVELDARLAKPFLKAGQITVVISGESPRADRSPGTVRNVKNGISAKLQVALDRGYTRGRETAAAVLSRPDMLSSEEMAKQLGVSRETVNQWRRKGKLLGLEGDARGIRYPDWQLREGRLLEGLENLARLFGHDAWMLYRFLVSDHDGLDGQTGVEAMRAGTPDRVLRVAEGELSGAGA